MHRREINKVQDTPQNAPATYFNKGQRVSSNCEDMIESDDNRLLFLHMGGG